MIDYKNRVISEDGKTYDEKTFHLVDNHSNDWCTTNPNTNGNSGHIVLYIPGHEGQYKQSRSIAAHGINLSQNSRDLRDFESNIRHKLMNGTMSKESHDVNNFLYDIYTVDFNGEGGAWHASMLHAQADFVVKCIERLVDQCKITGSESISLVAHSIGGIVARKAVITLHQKWQNNDKGDKSGGYIIKNVITLATPHQFIPFVFDQSLMYFLQSVEDDEKTLMKSSRYESILVSISGGFRDEMIPQRATYINHLNSINTSVTSVLASDIMDSRVKVKHQNQSFGMDHQCIVWCYGLLSVLRELLHIYVQSSHESKVSRELQISEFLNKKMTRNGLTCNRSDYKDYDAVNDKHHCNENACSFECRSMTKDELLEDELGFMNSISIQTAMTFNIRIFVTLFAINSILYQLLIFVILAKILKRETSNRTKVKISGYCYLICPIVSSVVYMYCYPIKEWENKKVIYLLLSFSGMNLHHIILYASLPLISRTICIIKSFKFKGKQRDNGIDTMSIKSSAIAQITMIKLSIILHFAFCTLHAFTLGIDNDWALNRWAIISHINIIIIILITLNICSLGLHSPPIKHDVNDGVMEIGFTEDAPPKEDFTLLYRMTCTLLLPIFPIVSFGKLVYWWTLLTIVGQSKSTQYIQINNSCQEADGMKYYHTCSMKSLFMQCDLGFVMKICFPLYSMLLFLHYLETRYFSSLRSATKKSK